MKKPFPLNRQTCIRALFCTMITLFAAHAFCFFNLTYSSPSLMINAAAGNSTQTAAGMWLQPFYWRIRGAVASPLFIGLLCAAYLALNAMITCELLGLSSRASIFLLCGAMTANSAVTSVLAAQLPTADTVFLAQLLGTAAVFLGMRFRFGFVPAAVLTACALGFDSTIFPCAASLLLITVTLDLLRGNPPKIVACRAAKTMLAFCGGAALYAAGYALLLSRRSMEAAASLHLQEGGPLSAWFTPIRTLLAPLTAYTHVNVLVRILLAALCLAALLTLLHRYSLVRRGAVLLLVLLLPLCANLPVFSAAPAGQYPLSFVYIDVFATALLSLAFDIQPKAKRLLHAAAAAFSVLFLSATVFSNQIYLKKNLEMQSTLSVMTRVIDRAEHTEGYRPGYTHVAIVGTLEDSALSIPHRGFEHLAALDAASTNYAIASAEDAVWYIYQIIGYPFNLVSFYEQEQISAREDVKAMPAFPAEGCIQFVGDTLVIKLSN